MELRPTDNYIFNSYELTHSDLLWGDHYPPFKINAYVLAFEHFKNNCTMLALQIDGKMSHSKLRAVWEKANALSNYRMMLADATAMIANIYNVSADNLYVQTLAQYVMTLKLRELEKFRLGYFDLQPKKAVGNTVFVSTKVGIQPAIILELSQRLRAYKLGLKNGFSFWAFTEQIDNDHKICTNEF